MAQVHSIKNLVKLVTNSMKSKDAGLALQGEISLRELEVLVDASIEVIAYKKILESVLEDILEDANGGEQISKIGFAQVTWISLNRAERILRGELK